MGNSAVRPKGTRSQQFRCCVFGLLVCALGSGCESLNGASLMRLGMPVGRAEGFRAEEDHRQSFQTEGDSEAMRWLLANRVESGLSVAEVNRVFGQEGEREFGDNWLKTNGGHLRADDVVYKWGPDRDGHSVYLGFRDGRLVNFDPSEFRESF